MAPGSPSTTAVLSSRLSPVARTPPTPWVMVAAALVAKKAVEHGVGTKPWVKTTLAPGSKVVTDYYDRAGLTAYLDKLGFQSGRLRLHHMHRKLRTLAR